MVSRFPCSSRTSIVAGVLLSFFLSCRAETADTPYAPCSSVAQSAAPTASAASAPAASAASAPDPAKAASAASLADLDFAVQCVQVMDEPQGRLDGLYGAVVGGRRGHWENFQTFLLGSPDTSPQARTCPEPDNKNPPPNPPLVGAGQLTVFVCTKDYTQVEFVLRTGKQPAQQPAGSKANTFNVDPEDKLPAPNLVLNGFDMGTGGEHLSTEVLASGLTSLRYRLKPDKNSDKAWATLYRERGFTGSVDLRPALAWNGQTVFRVKKPLAPLVGIQVTDAITLVEAVVLSSVFLAIFFWALRRMDIFRESPALPWWDEADLLRDRVRAVKLGRKSWLKFLTRDIRGIHAVKAKMAGMKYWAKGTAAVLVSDQATTETSNVIPESDAVIKLIKDSTYGGENFDQSKVQGCLDWADKAISGNYPVADSDIAATVVGLALTRRRWQPVRGAYSLASVQVGVWMMFACIAAIFLWVVYGALPAIVGSLLGLVSITVVVAGASWIIDPVGKQYLESQGLWRDLMTGADGQSKVHRFQAVLVNLLLLVVGINWLLKFLTYPTFDDTWLQFLGLSGLAQTVGKSVNEGSKPGVGVPAQ